MGRFVSRNPANQPFAETSPELYRVGMSFGTYEKHLHYAFALSGAQS
jgi:hypothetical protein